MHSEIRLKFSNPRVVPPGEYFYVVPELGAYVSSSDSLDLRTKVLRLYGANNLPMPEDIDEKLQHFMSRNLPRGFSKGPHDEYPDLTKCAYATFFLVEKKPAIISSSESRKRAAVCKDCPLNKNISFCPEKNNLRSARKLYSLDCTRACNVCMVAYVWLPVMLRVGIDVLRETVMNPDNYDLPEGCWLK